MQRKIVPTEPNQMHLFLIRLMVVFVAIIFSTSTAFGTDYFIDPEFGSGDGSSWDEAAGTFADLFSGEWGFQSGDVIYVAKGSLSESEISITSDLFESNSGTINIICGVDNTEYPDWDPSIDYTDIHVLTPGTGGTADRVFNINALGYTINISDVTIRGGDISANSVSGAYGGGIYIQAGTVNFEDVTISGSKAQYGGGIYLSSNATCSITNSTIKDNIGTVRGGGISNNSGTISNIINSTISGNICTDFGGGGIYNKDGTISNIANSTIANNTSSGQGGGIFIFSFFGSSSITMSNSTVSGNSATGNGDDICNGGSLTVANSIIDDYYDNSGTLTDNGFNVVEFSNDYTDWVSEGTFVYTDKGSGLDWYQYDGSTWTRQSGATLNLSSLADNGGPTYTLALTEGSFAAGSADGYGIPYGSDPYWNNSPQIDGSYTDQRGVVRTANQNTSIGAYSENYTLYYYKSTTNGGDWDVGSGDYTWTRSLTIDGSYGNTYESPTTDNSISIIIVSGATVSVSSDVEIDQTTIASGATLAVNSGSTLTIADGDGNDLTITGTLTNNGSIAILASSTVVYNGSNQTVLPLNYAELSFAGSTSGSTKTFADGVTTISSEMDIDESITFTASSSDNASIQVPSPGVSPYRLFAMDVNGKTFNVSNLTLKGGNVSSGRGGIIDVRAGTVNMDNCILTGSKAQQGGAIGLQTNYMASGSIDFIITNSTISNNTATGSGGAIYVFSDVTCDLTIINSTINGNSCTGDGGAIYCNNHMYGTMNLNLKNSTICNNVSNHSGGAVYGNNDGGNFDMGFYNSTIANNHSDYDGSSQRGGGLYLSGGTLAMRNTIIANNYRGSSTSTSDDYYYSTGTLTDNGYNVVEYSNVATSATGGFDNSFTILFNQGVSTTEWSKGNEVLSNQNLNLSEDLADNGGPTETLALTAGSFAAASISSGIPPESNWNNSPQIGSEYTDQRGIVRTSGQNTSIGAYSENYTLYYYKSTADGGDWDVAQGDYTWTRSLTIDGTYVGTYIAPTVENSALVTIVSGATVTVASGVEIDQTTIESGATLTVNSGFTLTIADGDGADLTINGALDINGTISIGTATVDANGSFDAAGGAVTFTDAGNLNLGGNVISLGTFTKATSTITYDGGSQTILPLNYSILQLDGSGTKTFSETTTATGGVHVLANVAIEGGGASSTFVQAHASSGASATSDVFIIQDGYTVSISDMTIRYGQGGIYNYDTQITISNSTITDNNGSGILTQNSDLTITGSTISNNISQNSGGGIYNRSRGVNSTVTIINSTLSGNSAVYNGGGIYNKIEWAGHTSSVTIINSTIANNHSDITNNGGREGGGIYLHSGSLIAKNSIIANNYAGSGTTTGDDYCYIGGTLTDDGYNVVEFSNNASTATGGFNNSTSILYNTEYNQAGTSFNSWTQGGTSVAGSLDLSSTLALISSTTGTYTLALASTSFAAASATTGIPPASNWNNSPQIGSEYTDQRGIVRTSGQNTSIGAYSDNYIPPVTIYVNANVSGGTSDGTSWINAFQYLQDALAVAISGDQIWVAGGVYYPDEGTGYNDNGSTQSFQLIEGIKLYGGFAGTETLLSERDWATNPTILSGDIDKNDTNYGGSNIAETSADLEGNNSCHVVYANGGDGHTNITAATEVNGFIITAGNAKVSVPYNNGGGLYCYGEDAGNESSPALTNCRFSGNAATGVGGAIYNFGRSGVSSPVLTNCSFSGNAADGVGGAIYNNGYSGTSSPVLTNCSFSENVAINGGAIVNNGNNGTSSPVLTNCILWGNTASSGSEIYNNVATPTVSYSIVKGGIDAAACGSACTDDGNNLYTNPLFVDAASGDLRVYIGSPAINTGLNSANTQTYDLAHNARIQDGTINMGAYEGGVPSDYRSVTSVSNNWSDKLSWQVLNDQSTWIAATETPTASNSQVITINSNVIVDGDVSIDQTTVAEGSSIIIPTDRTLTINNGDGIDFTVNGKLDMDGGSLTLSSGAELFYGSGSMLEYSDGSSSQITTTAELPVSGGSPNLTINNTNGVALGSASTILGTLSLTNGTFTTGNYNFTVGNISGAAGISIGTGTVDVNGIYNVTGSTTFTDAGNLKLGGTVTSLGTFTSGTGTVTYDGADQTLIAGSSISYNTVALDGTGTKTATDELIATTLTIANESFNVELNGDETIITNAVDFQNTGTVAFGDASTDVLTFTEGISINGTSGPSAVSLQGTLKTSSTSGANVTLRSTTITGNATINSFENGIDIYDNLTINDNVTLTVTGASNPERIYFHNTINSASGGKGNLVLNPNSMAKIDNNIGSTTPLGTITITTGYVEYTSPDITVENLMINGGYLGGVNPSGNLDVENVTIASGATLVGSSNNINVSGNWVNSGTFTHNNGTVTFDGSSTQAFSGTNTFYNLTIANTHATNKVTASGTLAVNNNLQIDDGIFVSASDYENVTIASGATLELSDDITVSGNWTNNGTLTHNDKAVTFDGSGTSAITGSTSFYDFTCTTAGKTLEFSSTSGEVQTVTGTFTLTGADGNLITVAPSVSDDQADINISNSNVSYIDVSYSNNTGDDILTTFSTNGGNNNGWVFGRYYRTNQVGSWDWNTAANWQVSADGSTWEVATTAPDSDELSITIRDGANVTINSSITIDQTTVDASSSIIIPTGSTLTINNGDGNDFVVNGTLDMDGGSLVMSNGATLLYGQSSLLEYSDILASQTTTGAEFPENNGPSNLIINNSNGVTLAASRSLSANLSLLSGIFTVDANNMTVAGNVAGSAGISIGTGTVDVNGTYNVTGSTTFTGAGNLYLGGNVTSLGTLTAATGNVVFDGSASQSFSGTNTFYNLTIANTHASDKVTASGTLTVENNLSITDGIFVSASDYTNVNIAFGATLELSGDITVSGNWTNNGTFTSGTYLVDFDGSNSGKTITANGSSGAFYDITFSGMGGWTLQDNLEIHNQFSVASGEFISGNHIVTLQGTNATYKSIDVDASKTDWTGGTLNIQSDISQTLPTNETYNVLQLGRYGGTGTTVYDLLNSNPTMVEANTTVDNDARIKLTASATGINKVYNGNTDATVTLSSNLISGFYDDVTNAYTTATFASANVGTDKSVSVSGVSISGDDAAVYQLASVTASTTADITTASITLDGSREYDATADVASTIFTISGTVGTETLTLTGSGTVADKNIGTDKVVTLGTLALADGTDGGLATNYNLASGTADITATNLTVSGLTASNKIYDGNTDATLGGTATVTPLGTDDVVAAGTALGTFAHKNVGINIAVTVIGVSITGDDVNNYNLVQQTGLTANITAKDLTVTGVTNNKTYDGNTTGNMDASSAALDGVVAIDELKVTLNTGSAIVSDYAGAAVGIYTTNVSGMTISGDEAANYTLSQPELIDATISAQSLTITGLAQNKVYGETLSDGTGYTEFTSVGLQNSETIGSVTVAYNDGEAATDAVGLYTDAIAISAATGGTFTASNYDITYVEGNLTITEAALTITATNQNKIYGFTLSDGTGYTDFTSVGLINNENIGSVSVAYSDGEVATDAAGTYSDAIIISAATGGSFTASNYNITYELGDLTVTQAALTITATAQDKEYGNTLSDGAGYTEFTSVGLQNSETIGSVTVAYIDGEATTDAVGTYTDAIAISAATDGTFSESNYDITYEEADLTVTQAALTITADDFSKVVGTNLTFAGTEFTSSGLLNGDEITSVTLTSVGAASTATAGAYDVIPSNAQGTGLSNYSISYDNGTLTVANAAYYKTNLAGTWDWTTTANWIVSVDGSSAWTTATTPPNNSNAETITILSGTTVTVDANMSIDQTVIDLGGGITIPDGVTLEIGDGIATDIENNGTLTVNGTINYNNATYSEGGAATLTYGAASTLKYSGSSAMTAGDELISKSIANIEVINTAGVSLSGNVSISGDFTVDYHSSFEATSHTIELVGTSQALDGNITFYNLTKSVTTADVLTFGAGCTYVINGTTTLNGTVGNMLSLRSSSFSTVWLINPSGTRVISYVDVQDSQNLNATDIDATDNCTDSGNNIKWVFPPSVTTQAVTDIYSTRAMGHGNITDLGAPNPTAHGFCWSTTPVPTINDFIIDKGAASSTGAYTAELTGLTNAPTEYYVRAFATCTLGTTYYGEEVRFTTIATPTTQAIDIIFSNIEPTHMTLDWTTGSGSKRAVFVTEISNTKATASPVNGTTYNPNVVYGNGDQIGTSRWYCVYNGTGTQVTIEGLTPNTYYKAMVCEYNGPAGNEFYNTNTSTNNPNEVASVPVSDWAIYMGIFLIGGLLVIRFRKKLIA